MLYRTVASALITLQTPLVSELPRGETWGAAETPPRREAPSRHLANPLQPLLTLCLFSAGSAPQRQPEGSSMGPSLAFKEIFAATGAVSPIHEELV